MDKNIMNGMFKIVIIMIIVGFVLSVVSVAAEVYLMFKVGSAIQMDGLKSVIDVIWNGKN